jgi:hypothetical protein
MSLNKIWNKFTNRQRYREIKHIEENKKHITSFQKKHEIEINLIQKKIKDQKKLNFLHSGHAADIINVLPVIKKLSQEHECNLYININKPIKFYFKHPAGQVFINNKIFEMLSPLLKRQKYFNKVEKFIDQDIDINFDLFRELPINNLFDNVRYASVITGILPDLSESFLEVDRHNQLENKIIIQRTFRYRNNFINYEFLNNYKDLFFVGTIDEFKDLKNIVKNLEYYECKDFLDMAKTVKSSKFVLANSSITFPIAEGLGVPRLLEASPDFPAAQPHGKNAFNFYFQTHFEKLFSYLNNFNNS